MVGPQLGTCQVLLPTPRLRRFAVCLTNIANLRVEGSGFQARVQTLTHINHDVSKLSSAVPTASNRAVIQAVATFTVWVAVCVLAGGQEIRLAFKGRPLAHCDVFPYICVLDLWRFLNQRVCGLFACRVPRGHIRDGQQAASR